MKTLKARLAWARNQAGVSQRELCRLAGLSMRHVAFIEAGQLKNPGGSTLVKLADALGVRVEWLLLGQEPTPDAAGIRDHVRRLLSGPSELQQAAGEDLPRAAGAR